MKVEAISPWPLLLAKLRLASRASISRTELDAAGLDANELLRLRVIERLDSGQWMVPDCEHDCHPNLDFDTRREEGLVGIACPHDPACWPGWRWHPVQITEMFCCSAASIFNALREANGLAPLEIEISHSIVPVGVLRRRSLTIPVVWMLRPIAPFSEICLGLRNKLPGDGLIVMLSLTAGITTGVRLDGDVVILDLPSTSNGDLNLWRALDALNPSYRSDRVNDAAAIFDEVTMSFATVPGDRHIVTINGREFGGFQKSDLKFLRLLRLAAARAEDLDVDEGGWLKKYHLQGDDKDHDIENLRKELDTYTHPDLSEQELRSLIKSSPRRDGTVRLALQPRNIHFDSSLSGLHFLGEQQTTDKKGKRRRTPGTRQLEQNLAQGKAIALKLLKDCRKHGVPCPDLGG